MRRHGVLLGTLIVLLLALAACGGSGEGQSLSATNTVPAANPTEGASNPGNPATYLVVGVRRAYERLLANEEAQLLDVRQPEQWAATGVVAGAHLISLAQVEQRAPAELAKDKPVYVICTEGIRSRVVAETLIRLGFSSVYNVNGGMEEWLKAGLPVEAYTP
jgi:rhodanese-related sulfurtransferase